jgi:hypothetical protein
VQHVSVAVMAATVPHGQPSPMALPAFHTVSRHRSLMALPAFHTVSRHRSQMALPAFHIRSAANVSSITMAVC